MGRSGGGFSGEGTVLTFTVFPDEPDTDEFLASLTEVHSPLVKVFVGLLDRMVGRIGLGGYQCFAALRVGDMKRCSVERLGVDEDATPDRIPYGLFG